ncbi:unnamed protein product [Closterium sp. Naga37s-1]|nr:unnamed protein product [Closterium sp. Naga37s-1]
MACEGCDLGLARAEMSVLLFVLQCAIDNAADKITGGNSGGDEESGLGEAAVSALGDDMGIRKDAEREARTTQAWRMVRLGQLLPARGVGVGGGTAGVEGRYAGGSAAPSTRVSGEASGRELLDGEMRREEMREAEELWHGQSVLHKAAYQVQKERRESRVQWQAGTMAQHKGRAEWKGAEQLRAELMLAHLGLQMAVGMLQRTQQRLVLWLEGSRESTACQHATAAATAAQRMSVVLPCTGILTPAPAIAHVQHKVGLWWARWSARLTPLLHSLHHLHSNAMPVADSHLPRLHAAFSLLSASFHRRLSSSYSASSSCQLDDMALPWAKGVALEPLVSTGKSGEMDGWRAVKVVAGVWTREYASWLNGAKRVACNGAGINGFPAASLPLCQSSSPPPSGGAFPLVAACYDALLFSLCHHPIPLCHSSPPPVHLPSASTSSSCLRFAQSPIPHPSNPQSQPAPHAAATSICPCSSAEHVPAI